MEAGDEGAAQPVADSDAPWARFYEAVADVFDGDPFPFFNLGYAEPAPSAPEVAEAGEQIAELLSRRLYDRAVAGVALEDRVVVEVGCGRGGGCDHIARAHRPARLVGVDRSLPLVRLCSEAYDRAGLRFAQGDAAELPIADRSVDVLVNVESSHCYAAREDFFAEVARVLKPGGRFALADILFVRAEQNRPEAIERLLRRAGFEVLRREEMTPGVVKARDLVSRSTAFRERLRRSIRDAEVRSRLEEIFCLHGSPNYDALREGKFVYWRWTARLPT